MRSHWGWDIGAWDLTKATARLLKTGATGARWSRLWIDLNRAGNDPALVVREVEGHALSWNREVDERAIKRRYKQAHVPFHREVDREIMQRVKHGVRPVLLSIHTYTSVWLGRERAYEAGVLYDEDRGAATRLARALRGIGLSVRYNEPYSGRHGRMYSIDRHGRRHGLPCLELEVNQKLFERKESVQRLSRAVAAGMIDIAERTRSRR